MDQQNGALRAAAQSRFKPARRVIRQTFWYVLAAACLAWVLYDIHVGTLLRSIANINWWWVALAIAVDILSYVCQGLRWHFLLRPAGYVSVSRTTQAVYAGVFTNEVLPMRFGELVRGYLVSRWMSAGFASVIPSMAVERLLDGIWLAVAVGLTAILVPLPRNLLGAGDVFGILVLLATLLFIFAVIRKEGQDVDRQVVGGILGWKALVVLRRYVGILSRGVREIGLSRSFYLALGGSLLMLVLQASAFWLVMLGYGLFTSFWVGSAVFLIVHLGTSIPNAPGNMGTYQFFCVVGLTLFGVNKTLATGFSLVVFALLTIPMLVLGFLALSRSGKTLYAIKSEISEAMAGQK